MVFRCSLHVRARSSSGVRGGTIIVGPLNLGGSVELVHNPVAIAELAVDKQASTLLMPLAARRALNDYPITCGRRSTSSSIAILQTASSRRSWSSWADLGGMRASKMRLSKNAPMAQAPTRSPCA